MPHSLEETGVCSAGYFCELGSNTPTPNGINNTGVAGKCVCKTVLPWEVLLINVDSH